MQKRFHENVARVLEAVKEKELRGSLDKFARRKSQDVRGEARDELNAAVVQTISESQQDLGAPSAGKESFTQSQLQPGARIQVRGFSKPVVLRRIEGNSAEIEAGPLRMKVGLDEITGVEGTSAAGSARATKGSVTVRAQASDEGTGGEINLIGCTVEEATERVDKFLDEAALANRSRVRIIHGHGTGALRRGLVTFLKGHPLVKHTTSESQDRGGDAITLVDLSL
jgi:DNA mismatch repair protein MutS2